MLSVVAGGAALLVTSTGQAQTSDALLNKLVQKGILTRQEADELKKETDAGFDKAYRVRAGLPDWVTSLRLHGDLRGRVEGFMTENDSGSGAAAVDHDRWRLRYRLRVGMVATLQDQLELGFRLTSSEAAGGFGGDPISSNTTFQDNGSKKFLYIDTAYGKWTPINSEPWKLSGTFGKMENPFTVSSMIFDNDYTPEGAALVSSYSVNKEHTLKMVGGYYWLDEVAQGEDANNDAFLFGAQVRWDGKWTSTLETSFGLSAFALSDERTLNNGAVPNVNVGNTRAADGSLVNDYSALVVDAVVTYWLEKAPLYKGKFPVRLAGTYSHNPDASTDDDAYEAGLFLGKSGKKQTWEISHRWRRQEADSWYEELTESDFGAFREVALANSGAGTGYRSGTGVQGHIFKASYSPYDALTLGISYYLTELIDPPRVAGRETESDMHRIQVDAIWKF